MSSLRRRIAVRAFRLSYAVPFFGDLYRFWWELWNHSRIVDVYLRDMAPRQRRHAREIMRMMNMHEGSFDPRPEKPTLH